MVLKLHGAPVPSTQIVLLVLLEKKVPFELVHVDVTVAEHKGEKHLQNQPFGLVPFIDDDGFILHECRAIAQYIEMKYPHQGTQGLVPKELKAHARYLQAASIETGYFHSLTYPILMEKIFKPMYQNMQCDETVYKACVAKLAANLDVYESILAKQKYLGGDEITLADLYHLPGGTLLSMAGTNIVQARPNVSRWFAELSSRKSWRDVQKIAGVRPAPKAASVNGGELLQLIKV